MSSPSVLLIGLDGVDFRYLDQFSESLPNIQKCRETGVESSLPSTHPPWTGSAWPSLYTGVDPSYHGVFDFFDYHNAYPNEADVVTYRDVREPSIWDYLTDVEKRSVVVNVPITHPVEPLEGIIIPGYLSPADENGYPSGIRDEVSGAIGRNYNIYSEGDPPSTSEKIDGYEELIHNRARAAAHLLETESWDFAFVQVQKTDAVFHNSTSVEDFKRIYEAADNLVGRLIDVAEDETNVILCSDHGMGPVDGSTVYINEILKENGLVSTTSSDTSRMSMSEAKGQTDEGNTGRGDVADILAKFTRRMGIAPGSVYHAAQRLGIEDVLTKIVPQEFRKSLSQSVDWRNSQAFCRRASEQGIRINLEGRDPEGVVPQKSYEEIRDRIIDVLSTVKTEDGDPIFEFVKRREEIYEGPYTEEACDVIFRTVDMNHSISPNLYGRRMIPVNTYDHKDTGIFIASGPGLNSEWNKESISILDVAPIAFALLNESIPKRMMGSVPDDLVLNSSERGSYDVEVRNADKYSQDQSEVTDRLSDLGYL